MEKHVYFKFILLTLLLVSGIGIFSINVQASTTGWQKGASFVPLNSTSFEEASFKQTLQNLKNDNATYVNLVIPLYQSNIRTSDIHTGLNTPSDESLKTAIATAHFLGLKVSLKPHIESDDGNWRANINPTDRVMWFASYGSFMKKYATIGQAAGAEQFILGTELIDLSADDFNSQNTPLWRSLISDIRSVYSGSLTYAANWGPSPGPSDEKNRIAFWDLLDVVGIDAYYPLGNEYNNNSVDSLKSYWATIDQNDIGPFARRVGKPIIFTELGYRSKTGAHTAPSDFGWTDQVDMKEQSNLYQALFEYWGDKSYIGGVHIWNWELSPSAGGTNDTSYTPQNKPAESILREWFGGTATPSNPPQNNFSSNTSLSATSIEVGNAVSLNTSVSNSVSESASILTDIEVYNSSGGRVYQYFENNKSFSSPNTQTITTTFKPTTEGTYTIKVGVFSNDWSHNYLWQENAATLQVTASSNPLPQSSSIDIWWPTNTAHVSGVLPLKALLRGSDISMYKMYWQVDGGGLVLMGDSQADYPHKESWIDVSGWNWKSNNAYTLNFVAQDSSGRTLGQQSTGIVVDH